ncbi:MAG: hypothetical protein WCB23_03885, partial [Pseudolabrys sp.]
VRNPATQERIQAAFKRGLQTRDAEMNLARLLGEWVTVDRRKFCDFRYWHLAEVGNLSCLTARMLASGT